TLFTCAKKWDPPIVKVADDGERISRKRQRDVEQLPLLRVEDPDIAVVVWSRRRRHVRTHDRRDKLIDGVEGEQRKAGSRKTRKIDAHGRNARSPPTCESNSSTRRIEA